MRYSNASNNRLCNDYITSLAANYEKAKIPALAQLPPISTTTPKVAESVKVNEPIVDHSATRISFASTKPPRHPEKMFGNVGSRIMNLGSSQKYLPINKVASTEIKNSFNRSATKATFESSEDVIRNKPIAVVKNMNTRNTLITRSTDHSRVRSNNFKLLDSQLTGTHLVFGADHYLHRSVEHSSSSSSESSERQQNAQNYNQPSRTHLFLADRKVIPSFKQPLPQGTRFADSKFVSTEDKRTEMLK